jgi:hypothetical protein
VPDNGNQSAGHDSGNKIAFKNVRTSEYVVQKLHRLTKEALHKNKKRQGNQELKQRRSICICNIFLYYTIDLKLFTTAHCSHVEAHKD